jgi:hypothetical protein
VARARASSRQRDWWVEHFPDLVVARPCLMPLYARSRRSPMAFRVAAGLAHLFRITSPRLPPGRRQPGLRLVDRFEVLKRFPGLPDRGLKGGALWHEAFMPDSPRIVVECIRWAVAAGARALNYVAVQSARPARKGALPPRPHAAEGWNVLDRSRPVTRESLLDIAARESVVYLEDLIERRTNAWCDGTARRRVVDLVEGCLPRWRNG